MIANEFLASEFITDTPAKAMTAFKNAHFNSIRPTLCVKVFVTREIRLKEGIDDEQWYVGERHFRANDLCSPLRPQ